MFRRLGPGLLGPALWMVALAASAACGDSLPLSTRQEVRGEGAVLVFAPARGPIAVGQHFSLNVSLCSATGEAAASTKFKLVKVDADMPAHRHGMNYRATVRSQGAGRYRADGLMFHMPGVWRLTFDVDAGNGGPPKRLAYELQLE